MGSSLEIAIDWIVARVAEWGYGGIFAMMFVESSFVPFPSEVALIPAGYLASKGQMDPVLATMAGLGGSLGGAILNYGLALWLGRPLLERVARYFGVGQGQFDSAERYFARHGEITTFAARLVPGVRQLISIPAGLARMNIPRFLLYTGLGAGLWSAILVAIGFIAGESEEQWRPLFRDATVWLLLGGGLMVALYLYLHRRRERRA